ncbi:hypothetical protein SGCOL_008878 [Colletotrichum sp. CLE4]
MTRHHRPTALHLAAVLALLSATTNLPGQMFVPGVAAIEDLEAEDVPPECVQRCGRNNFEEIVWEKKEKKGPAEDAGAETQQQTGT